MGEPGDGEIIEWKLWVELNQYSMKKIFFPICCLFLFACQNQHQKPSQTIEKPAQKPGSAESLCFLSVVGGAKVQGKILQDSLVLKIKIRDDKVSGTYNWIPAEKDVRKGKFDGKKNGSTILGDYFFEQEGKKQTQPIRIELYERFAKVVTNPGMPEKMIVEIDKIDCDNN